jgi:hypothetical protein
MKRFVCAAALAVFAMACGGGASDPAGVCKKIGELAEKEGGEAKEMYDKRLKDDCVKELTEAKAELGDNWSKFTACVDGAKDFKSLFKDCDPDNFEDKDKDKKDDKK